MKEWLLEKKFLVMAVIAAAVILVYYLQEDPVQSVVSGNETLPSSFEGEDSDRATEQAEQSIIMVDVKGEVEKPGVYQVRREDRVKDVIERAGGLTKKADSSQVNFAQKLEDEMVVYIPAAGEGGQNEGSVNTAGVQNNGKVNINKASATELEEIPGIGPAKAAAIIDYRDKNGPFKEIADLKEISGIGDKTFEKLESSITVR